MRIWTLALAVLSALCAPVAQGRTVDYLGQQVIASGTQAFDTTIGGLSGIDYDAASDSYIAISDDRSRINPTRAYRLSIALDEAALTGVEVAGVTILRTPDGVPYVERAADTESVRLLPDGMMIYTSEGDTSLSIDAFVRIARRDGSFVRDIALPPGIQQTGPRGASGIRNNLGFEAMDVSPDKMTLTVATENALVQDGPMAQPGRASPSRILTFDLATGAARAQYAYSVDPIPYRSWLPGGFSTNGLVELIDEGGGKYLALERSFVLGHRSAASTTGFSARIYEIDINGASDISALPALKGASYKPVRKTLLLDLETLGIPLDNLEGMSLGPRLPDGSRSLILISDDNFSKDQVTQILLFGLR